MKKGYFINNMTKREKFIDEITKLLQDCPENYLSTDALDFWNALQITEDNEKPAFTENGKKILQYIKDNKDNFNNLFKAKDIGEGINLSSRTVSGSLRKLVNDGYLEKMGENPKVYSLTTKGEETSLDEN